MGWKFVLVPSYEADQPPQPPQPGYPSHPIYLPGEPAHPIVRPPDSGVSPTPPIYYPPVISGPPGPWPTPPIYLPPTGGGGGPTPTPPIYYPPTPEHPWVPPVGGTQPPGEPAHPIVRPPEQPPGIWGGAPLPVPTPPIYYPPEGGGSPPGIWGPPGPWPTPPIAMPQPPVDPGYSPPWATPSPPFPVIDPDDIPEHPDVPDLARGTWILVEYGGMATRAFLPNPQAHVDLPNYDPTFPPEQSLPGTWVVVYAAGRGAAWAWIPESMPTQPHPEPPPGDNRPDHTLPGDLPHPEPMRKG